MAEEQSSNDNVVDVKEKETKIDRKAIIVSLRFLRLAVAGLLPLIDEVLEKLGDKP